MKNINVRVKEYNKKLNLTKNGYIKSLDTEKDKERIKNFKKHIENIQKILSFGVQDYMALDSLTNINFYAENYSSMSKELNDSYMNGFGIDNKHEMDMLLKDASSVDDIRNIIWKKCMGMKYNLLSRDEVSSRIKHIQDNSHMGDKEKQEKIYELICRSGYDMYGLSNPTYINDGLDYLKPIMQNIKLKNT